MSASKPSYDGSASAALEKPEGDAEGGKKKDVTIPESLSSLQSALLRKEFETDRARAARNIEIARLRDEAKISQYRIAKWLGVTERAVMLMAKQGREYRESQD